MSSKFVKFKGIKSFIINFGPQHPAAHGCFAISFGVGWGEIVLKCVPHCWFFTSRYRKVNSNIRLICNHFLILIDWIMFL